MLRHDLGTIYICVCNEGVFYITQFQIMLNEIILIIMYLYVLFIPVSIRRKAMQLKTPDFKYGT